MNFLKLKINKVKCKACGTVFERTKLDKHLDLCVKCQNEKDGVITKEERKKNV